MTLSETDGEAKDLLAVSTEDGRILFHDTTDLVETQPTDLADKSDIPISKAICQLGGPAEGIIGRVKDFEILKPLGSKDFIVVTGSSDGAVRLWTVNESELVHKPTISNGDVSVSAGKDDGEVKGNIAKLPATRQIGSLLGTYEAGNRITCLKAFVMSEPESLEPNGSVKGNCKESDSGSDDVHTSH